MADLEGTNAKARQAVVMADDAGKRGDTGKAIEYTKAAESFAGQLVQTERQVESLKTLSLQSTQAADQAKAAVEPPPCPCCGGRMKIVETFDRGTSLSARPPYTQPFNSS